MADFDGSVRLVIKDQVAWITLNKPEQHNALSAEDIELFLSHLEYVESRLDLRVLVITGRGPKTFCAGVSLVELASGGDIDITQHFEMLTKKLVNIKIPTLCAMNGSAYGGGAEIALCCDFRMGVKGMQISIPAARFGLCYPLSGIQHYIQRLGINTTKILLLAAATLDAEELLAVTYLTHLVDVGELDKAAKDMADDLSKLAPLAVIGMKQICDQIITGIAVEHKQDAEAIIRRCRQSEDFLEGLSAMRERRQPQFTGEPRVDGRASINQPLSSK